MTYLHDVRALQTDGDELTIVVHSTRPTASKRLRVFPDELLNKEYVVYYMFFKHLGKHYVGFAKNLRARMKEHLKPSRVGNHLFPVSTALARDPQPVLKVLQEDAGFADEKSWQRKIKAKYGEDNLLFGCA